MSVLIVFIQKAIVQGICILYGALGEIMTEKSGNLNLGIPGIMYMGGISGLMGAFLYEKDNPDPNALVGVLISFLCAFACAAIGGLIYSILTITLRVNQNVTGLALTIFGTGFGNFFGGSISKLAGGVGQISVKVTGSAYTAKIPGLSKIPVIGGILFNYGFLFTSVFIALCQSPLFFPLPQCFCRALARPQKEAPAAVSLFYALPDESGSSFRSHQNHGVCPLYTSSFLPTRRTESVRRNIPSVYRQ